MQETRYNDEIRQKVFSGKTQEEIEAMMNADLRNGEQVVRRRELTQGLVVAALFWRKSTQ